MAMKSINISTMKLFYSRTSLLYSKYFISKSNLTQIRKFHKTNEFQSSNDSFHTNQDNKDYDSMKESILTTAMSYVKVLGWSKEAILQAARDLHFAQGATLMSNGNYDCNTPVDLVYHFLHMKRNHVQKVIQQEYEYQPRESKLERVICLHLDYLAPFIKSWPSAIALLLDPRCISQSTSLLMDIANDLCDATDTQASRLDWYSERILLVSLYGLTEVYMLADDSEDFVDTK